MNKYVKHLFIVFALSLIVSYLFFFRTEITLESGIEYKGEIVNSDITIEDGYISISSFLGAVMDNHWTSEDDLIIKANHESEGISNYKFDSISIDLEKLDSDLEFIDILDEKFRVLKRIGDYDAILSKDNGDYSELFFSKGEKVSKIGTIKQLDQSPFLLSKNMSKLIYLDNDNKINTYNIVSGKKRNSIIIFDDVSEVDFFSRFSISDDGGFFLYSKLANSLSESSFSIYGADTGKVYAKDIIGVNPSWSYLSDKVAFFYSGDVTSNILYKSRIGILDLKSKKIVYYDKTGDDENYFGKLNWTKDNEKIVFTSSIKNENYINILNISKMMKLNYNVSNIKLEDNIEVVGNKVYWLSEENNQKKLSVLETTGESPAYVDDLRVLNNKIGNYIISSGEDVYVIQGNSVLLVSGEDVVQIAHIDEYSDLLSISQSGNYMLLEKVIDEKSEIKIYTLK